MPITMHNTKNEIEIVLTDDKPAFIGRPESEQAYSDQMVPCKIVMRRELAQAMLHDSSNLEH